MKAISHSPMSGCFRPSLGHGQCIQLSTTITHVAKPNRTNSAPAKYLIAPDLLGHGDSSTPRGDYSLGAHAGGLRDLLDELGVQRATLVGHSLGGGVALQFAWLFPERVERLVLVSSGGLGRELSLLLRVPTMPGVGFMLPVVSSPWVLRGGGALGRQLHRLGMRSAPDLEELWRGYSRLGDVGARRAFLATLRTVVDPGGQTINATDKLPVMAEIPTMIVWGGRDRLIPVRHGLEAHRAIPSSRLEIFPKAGHFPHLEEPRRFAGLLVDFVEQTEDRLVKTAVPPGDRQAGPRLGGDVSARTSGIDALAWTTPPDGHRAGSASAAGRTEPPPSSATSVVPGWRAHSPARC